MPAVMCAGSFLFQLLEKEERKACERSGDGTGLDSFLARRWAGRLHRREMDRRVRAYYCCCFSRQPRFGVNLCTWRFRCVYRAFRVRLSRPSHEKPETCLAVGTWRRCCRTWSAEHEKVCFVSTRTFRVCCLLQSCFFYPLQTTPCCFFLASRSHRFCRHL